MGPVSYRRKREQVLLRACFAVDMLESRRLLSSSLNGTLLTIDGTAGNDDISVGLSAGQLVVTLNGNSDGSFDAALVDSIQVNALDGDDSVSLAGVSTNATLSGGNGNDTLVGGDGNDSLAGGDDNDTFFSNDGKADAVAGGPGLDTVSIADNSLDTFTSIEAGIPAPHVAVTRNGNPIANGAATPIDFGTVTQGDTGPTRTFVLKNDGTDTLTIGTLVIPAGFTIVDNLVSTLAPGDSDSFTLGVDTTVAGNFSGTVSFSNSDPVNNPFTFNVSAVVEVPPPQIPEVTVSLDTTNIVDGQTTPIPFGTVTQGDAAPTLIFTVKNDGLAALNLSSLTVPAGYTIVEGLSGTLAPGESDTFTVRLDTTVVGNKPGQITFSNNDTDEDPFNFAISGKILPSGQGPIASVVQARPNLLIDSGNTGVEFGNRGAAQIGPTRTFRVTNTGDTTLVLGAVSVPSGFTLIDGGTGASLAAGQTTTFTLRMETTNPGPQSGFVSFATNDDARDPFTFLVQGTVTVSGSPTPELTIRVSQSGQLRGVANNASSFSFGTAEQGTKLSKVSRTFTVINDGNGDLSVGAVTLPYGFKTLDGLPSTIKAGASELLVIALDTSAIVGDRLGTVSIANNDSDESPFNFNVSGKIVPADTIGTPEITVTQSDNTPIADGAATPISFGSVVQNSAAPSRTFRVRNDGNANLTVGAVSLPSGFSLVSPLASTIAPGATASFTVRLNTNSTGAKSGNISFSTNDANENPFNFAIAGNVTPIVSGTPDVTASLSGGTLTVNGTSGIDTITFSSNSGKITVVGNGKTVSGSPFSSVNKIVVNGNDGADRIVIGSIAIPATLNGGNGNDTLIGGNAGDSLLGGAGDDDLDGGSGNDTVRGGSNNDAVTGGPGLDSMLGEDGNDTINAADGLADLLVDGGSGNDLIHKDRTDNATNT